MSMNIPQMLEQMKQQYARQRDFLIFILHDNIISPTFILESF